MRKLIILGLFLFLLPCLLQAQQGCKDSEGFFDSPLCDANGNLIVAIGPGAASTVGTFAAADATTSIGAAYAASLTPAAATKVVVFDNQTDGDVWVSMDAGTTSHFHITAGDVLSLDLAASGLTTTAAIHTKDGTTASTTGTFYIYTYK